MGCGENEPRLGAGRGGGSSSDSSPLVLLGAAPVSDRARMGACGEGSGIVLRKGPRVCAPAWLAGGALLGADVASLQVHRPVMARIEGPSGARSIGWQGGGGDGRMGARGELDMCDNSSHLDCLLLLMGL